MDTDQISSSYVTVDTKVSDKQKCIAEGKKVGQHWQQQPQLISTQSTCLQKFPPFNDQSPCDLTTIRARAAKLGIQVGKLRSGRALCRLVNEEEQKRCLFSNHKCPKGMLPDWPNNPTCCQPIKEVTNVEKATENAVLFIEKVKLSQLKRLYPDVATFEEQRKLLAQTQLDASTQEKLLAKTAKSEKLAEEYEKTLPEMNDSERQFTTVVVNLLQKRLASHLTPTPATTKAAEGESLVEPAAKRTWLNTLKSFASMVYKAASMAFDVIAFIMRNPVVAMWITQLALRLKEKVCRELSITFGFHDKMEKKALLPFLAHRAKTYYNQNWEAVVLTTVHTFVNGSGLDWIGKGIASGLSWALSAALAFVPIIGVPGAMAASGLSYLVSSGIADAMKDSLGDAIREGTNYLIFKKTGTNFSEFLMGACLQDQSSVVYGGGVFSVPTEQAATDEDDGEDESSGDDEFVKRLEKQARKNMAADRLNQTRRQQLRKPTPNGTSDTQVQQSETFEERRARDEYNKGAKTFFEHFNRQ